MQVLYVAESIIAGTRRHLYALATHVDPARFQVTIACPLQREGAPDEGGFVDDVQRAGVPVVPIPMRRSLDPTADAHAFRQLRATIAAGSYAIVHTHSSKAGFLGRLAARLERVPSIIHTPHGLHFLGQRHPLKRRFYLQLERTAARWCDCIIALSPGERNALIEHKIAPAARIVQIANGVDPDVLVHGGDVQALRAAHGIPPNAPLVGTLARVTAQKNPELFVRAAAAVAARFPDAHFVWIGGGELLGAAQQQAADLGIAAHCHFLGHQEQGTTLLAMCDLFWLTSNYEGLPYALLEALALALPTIATDVVGNRDVVDHDVNGLLVPPNDATGLTDATIGLLKDRERATALGRAGRAHVIERYSIERMVADTQQLYETLAASHHRVAILEEQEQARATKLPDLRTAIDAGDTSPAEPLEDDETLLKQVRRRA